MRTRIVYQVSHCSRLLAGLFCLRKSTYLAVLILVIIFVLLNLPGREIVTPELSCDNYGLRFTSEYLVSAPMEHGWPKTYLWRTGVSLSHSPWSRLSPWRLLEGVKNFDAAALAIDILFALIVIFVVAAIFEKWRRQRKSWQWYVSDVFFLMLAAAICMSYIASMHYTHDRQTSILQEANHVPAMDQQGEQDWTVDAQWEPSVSLWLQSLFGHDNFKKLDHVVGVTIGHSQQLKLVVKLQTLRGISIGCQICNKELRLLEQCPQLEALEMTAVDIEGPEVEDEDGNYMGSFFQIPRLPKLRALDMYGTPFRGEGLEHLPSLVAVSLDETEVDDEALSRLAGCKHLKVLSLCNTPVTNKGLKHLIPLGQLESLTLSGTDINNEGVHELASLDSLRSLDIGCWDITDSAIPSLQKLTRLERLNIEGTRISQKGLKELQRALPNCQILGP